MNALLRKGGWGIGAFLLLYLGIAYGVYRHNKADFEAFNRARIVGVLRSLKTQNHGGAVVFTLSDNQRYRFFPRKQQGGAAGFMALATPGDNVRKVPGSTTLLLIKPSPKRHVVSYNFDRVLY